MADFIRIPSNPVPENAEALDMVCMDGGSVRAAVFPAPTPKGTAILLNGRCEFIEKYFEVIGDLHDRGLNVVTMDWRGQGLSERFLPIREKGHIQDFGVFRADLDCLFKKIAEPRFKGPYFLVTHSMGGLPALQRLADGDDRFAGAVLCAPMTQIYNDPIRRAVVRAISQIGSALGASRQGVAGVKEHSLAFEGNVLTSDEARHERFRALQVAAPNAALREPTYGWVRAATAAIDDIHKPGRLTNLKTPVRIISASDDRLISAQDHLWLAEQSDYIETIVIQDALHEIMMERDEFRDQYWQAFDAFVEPKLAA